MQVICDFAGAEVQNKCRGCGDAQAVNYSKSRCTRCRCAGVQRCNRGIVEVKRFRGAEVQTRLRGLEVQR